MKTTRALLVFLCFLIALFTVQTIGCKGKESLGKEGTEVGNLAPDFELKKLNGETVSLKEFRGRTVLLSFGTTWCPYCLKEIPALKDIHEKFGGIKIIYVDVQEGKAVVDELVAGNSIPYTVLLDEDGKTSAAYKILGFPTVFIIDKEGVLRYKGYGIPEDLEKFGI